MKRQQLPTLLLSLMLVGQMSFVGTALAAKHSDSTPSPTVSPEESTSPDPSASPDPTSSATPDPTPTPKHQKDPSPDPSASPSPTPSASPKPKKPTDACYGAIPDWVYDTTTSTWVKADKGSFSCDPATHLYLSPKYFHDMTTSLDEIVSPAAAAAGVASGTLVAAPNVVHTSLGDLVVGSTDYNNAKALGLLDGPGGIATSGNGSGSGSQATIDNSSQNWLDLTNLVNVINTLQSAANSGNVTATSNTQAGDAITGAASVISNLINLLASAWSWSNGGLNFFMQNILGNQAGDINLNPTETTTGGGGQAGGSTTTNNSSDLNVNAQSTGNIVNNVDLDAQSGNASASKNSLAGNVATGDALAQVNIINLINSYITSGSSFFGILNIMGNLNGDILFPTGFLNGLTASGAATGTGLSPDSSNQTTINNTANTNINTSLADSVDNNVKTAATSGSATANTNSSVGAVATGAAATQQNLFNLAGKTVFGDNAVLVIVNVLGHWVGKVVGLDSSSTGGATESALLTGNAQVGNNGTAPDSTNQTTVNNTENTNVNQSVNGTITNNVNVNAESGAANANKNTQVGDVTSGNAKASSSVANIFDTIVNVKHWFGVLVINVLGDWVGDVNNNTSAGDAVEPQTQAKQATTSTTSPTTTANTATAGDSTAAAGSGGTVGNTATSGAQVAGSNGGKVLTAAAQQPVAEKVAGMSQSKDMSILFILSALAMLVAGALASIEKKLRRR